MEDTVMATKSLPARRQNPGSAAVAARRRAYPSSRRSAACATGPNSLKLVSPIRLGDEHRAVDAEGVPPRRVLRPPFLWQHVATVDAAIGLGPQPVAVKERRAVALAQRHRGPLQLGHASGPKGVAVKRSVLCRPSTAPASHRRMARAHRRSRSARRQQTLAPQSRGARLPAAGCRLPA